MKRHKEPWPGYYGTSWLEYSCGCNEYTVKTKRKWLGELKMRFHMRFQCPER